MTQGMETQKICDLPHLSEGNHPAASLPRLVDYDEGEAAGDVPEMRVSADNHDPDEDLIRSMADNDPSALSDLMDRHMGRMSALTYSILKDRALADDVVQIVFMKSWQTAPQWHYGQARLLTWMYKVAYRECLHLLRKKKPIYTCLLYTSPSPRDQRGSRMPSSA